MRGNLFNIGVVSNQEQSGGTSYVLDDFPNALGAFSLRKLSNAFVGKPIHIARTTIGFTEEVDIGFDSNDEVSMDSPVTAVAPSTTLATNLGEFLWAATYANPDGLPAPARSAVVTWYDQSGNGLDFIQGAPGYRPAFNSPGNFYILNGKPSINFDGSNDELIQSGVFGLSATNTDIVQYSVQQFEDTRWTMARGGHNGDYYFVAHHLLPGTSPYGSSPGTSPPNSIYKNGTLMVAPDQQVIFNEFSSVAVPPIGQTLLTFTGIDFISWSVTLPPPAPPIVLYELWGYDGINTKGKIQEFILYNAPNHPTQTDIETAINTYYTIYP